MSDEKMEHSTVYDDVFRTMIERTPKLMVYLINEVFSENYDGSVEVIRLQNEFLTEEKKIITDSYIRIGDKYYHTECQSNPDGSMAIRMIEYDFMITLRNAEKNGHNYTVKYPHSCVLYLRHNNQTPDCLNVTVEMPDERRFTYQTPIIKVQEYTLDEIFQKKLLAFLPYYILRYEKELNDIELDADKRQQFVGTYRDMLFRLREDQDLSEFELVKIKEHILTILDWVAKSEECIKKEVREMCGKVIRTTTDDIYDSGKTEGIALGKTEGIELGKRELVLNMYKNGMSTDAIAKMVQISLETIAQWISSTAKPTR